MSEMADTETALIAGRVDPEDHRTSPQRLAAALARLGSPQRSLRIVHVAGTNGKTSTAIMIDELLRDTGVRTGRFTSPHLADIRERIVVDGVPVSADRFVAAAAQVRAHGAGLSFFETLTAMALWEFAVQSIPVVVVEVGRGGRDDATNALDGEVAVITSIGLDHAEILGPTLESIAEHKAGIIKLDATVVLAPQHAEVSATIEAAAAGAGAREVIRLGRELQWRHEADRDGRGTFRVQTPRAVHAGLSLTMVGEHQIENGAVAVAAAEAFLQRSGQALPTPSVRKALARAASPGRLQVVCRDPLCLVDMSHNPPGMTATVTAVSQTYPGATFAVVIAISSDKDARAILETLRPIAGVLIATDNGSERCVAPSELARLGAQILGPDRVQAVDDFADAVTTAFAHPAGHVLVTGSIFTAARAGELIGRPDPSRGNLQPEGE